MTAACRRCSSRAWWRTMHRGRVCVTCAACGYEPSRAQRDPRYATELRAEMEQRKAAPALPTHMERALAALYEGAA